MSFRYPRQVGEDVVILGAGFSRAISGHMPLLNVGKDGTRSFAEHLFTDHPPVNQGSEPVRKPLIEASIRRYMQSGTVINVEGSSEDFQIGAIDAHGVTALIGQARVPLPIAWQALGDVLHELSPTPEFGPSHGGNLTVGGTEYRDADKEASVHRVMSHWINRFSAVDVAMILKTANLAELTISKRIQTLPGSI